MRSRESCWHPECRQRLICNFDGGMPGGLNKHGIQLVLSELNDAEAMALWNALAQWVDNESSRDDLEEDEKGRELSYLRLLEPVIERLNAAIAEMHGADVQEIMNS
jgi:hypothetical protein